MTKFTQTIRLVGNSKMITIPKDIVKQLHIDEGDEVNIEIKNLTKKIISYKCIACEHFFDMENDEPYCPICGEDTTLIEVGDEKQNNNRNR